MKIKVHFLILISLSLISNIVVSQKINDSLLLSSNLLFPKLMGGIVTMTDGNNISAKLNYNPYLDQFQFLGPKDEIMSFAQPEKISKVVIQNRTFVSMKNYFVEKILDGPVSLFLRLHKVRLVEKIGAYGGTSPGSNIQSLSTINSDGGEVLKLSPNEEVRIQTDLIFYILIGEKVRIVTNQNDLLKCFNISKELVKEEVKNEHTKFASLDSMKKLIEWVNIKGIKD